MADDLYKSLPLATPRSIRLLDLDQDDRSEDCSKVTATLRVVNLDDKPKFDALSYVWGQANTTSHSVICGSHEIKVTQNCYSALLHLRQKVNRLLIWVDAICINQQGEEEKRHQLPLMQAIYTRAKTVYIWLGIGNCATARAMNFFSTGLLRDQCLRDKVTPLWKRFSGFAVLERYYIASTILYRRKPTVRNTGEESSFIAQSPRGKTVVTPSDLFEALQNPWMTRIWTFQEIMLATNPVMVYGTHHTPWSHFTASLYCLSKTSWATDRPGLPQLMTHWISLALNKEHFDVQCPPPIVDTGSDVQFGCLKSLRDYLYHLAPLRMQFLLGIVSAWCVVSACIFYTIEIRKRSRLPLDLAYVEQLCLICIRVQGLCTLLCFSFIFFSHPWDHFTHIIPRLRAPPAPPELQSLQYLYRNVFYRYASDPKDMFLGMRCILERLLGQDLSDFVNTHSKEELFSMLTECLVHLQPSMMLIEMAAVSRLLTGPSWVLDWSRPKTWALKSAGSATTYLYASGKAPRIRFDHDWGLVIVYGISIRTIVDVQRFQLTRTKYDLSDYQHHLQNISALSRLVRASHQHAESRQTDHQNSSRGTTAVLTQELSELFEKVRVANKDAESDLRLYLAPYVEILLSEHLQPEMMFKAFTTQYLQYDYCAPNDISVSRRDSEAIFRVHTAICEFLCHQKAATFECVFRASDSNSYPGVDIPKINFGICMTGVEVGDQVVLVEGSTMPLIMRAVQNSFKLVSPSFVVGLMNGEAWSARVMRYLTVSAERTIEVDYQEYAKLDQICIC